MSTNNPLVFLYFLEMPTMGFKTKVDSFAPMFHQPDSSNLSPSANFSVARFTDEFFTYKLKLTIMVILAPHASLQENPQKKQQNVTPVSIELRTTCIWCSAL